MKAAATEIPTFISLVRLGRIPRLLHTELSLRHTKQEHATVLQDVGPADPCNSAW